MKVNDKNLPVTIYVGRLEKITSEQFIRKLGEFQLLRLKTFTDFWLKKKRSYLDDRKALSLEALHYSYGLFGEHYPDELKRYEQSVFARYVQGTTAIEGNTITLRQAEELLEHDITPAGKSVREVYEILNFRKLRGFLEEYEGDVSERLIKKMHSIIMENLLESPGEYRKIQVLIEKAEHEPPPAFEVPELMRELVEWYRKNRRSMHPFELAVLLHTKFVTIHPFVDGNGRVARALMNFVLERNGYPTLYLGLENREGYLDAVAEGNKENYQPIIDFMYGVYINQHRTILNEIYGKIRKGEIEAFPEMDELLKQFMKLKLKG
ncbi:cell division protein Fic [Geoglobus acetivorans]|uniref:Cell division protein Fic n=1 Tax=Geoglobus acetivorans TaxID=565033 RepID=A0A0A7GGP4_GEOAI|nr:cell division protein Fic [Geoglobus acetivorans]